MLVGDVTRFAIETEISEIYASEPRDAAGYFILHVSRRCFGVNRPDATGMRFPLWYTQDRIRERGSHVLPGSEGLDAVFLIDIYLEVLWETPRLLPRAAPSLSEQDLARRFDSCVMLGDEAFDDGSYVFQIDVGDRARIIACMNAATEKDRCVSEIWMPSDEFYNILDEWQRRFEHELRTTPVGVKPKAV